MYLHNDIELFREVIYSTANEFVLPVPVVEKDYYVTMILQQLAKKSPACVFKGGTALSKCHHAIDRFSEDIDITFSSILTQGQRKKLKNDVIAGISEELGMPITDFDKARSRRDYNSYNFSYEPLQGFVPNTLIHGVKMETALGSIAFPTVKLPVDSYVYQFLVRENEDIVKEYGLEPFEMTIQSIARTLADKVFAICDYYMEKRIKRNSRHIYDIYMLLPKIKLDEEYKKLVQEIRFHRSQLSICPSASKGVNISRMLREIIDTGVYKEDYLLITAYFQNHPVDYEIAIQAVDEIADSGVFGDV